MAIVIDFVRRLAPWVYGACALMALWYFRVVILAHGASGATRFSSWNGKPP